MKVERRFQWRTGNRTATVLSGSMEFNELMNIWRWRSADRAIAKTVLNNIKALGERYAFVSVGDVCDLMGIHHSGRLPIMYGWLDVQNFKVCKDKASKSYRIKLTMPVRI